MSNALYDVIGIGNAIVDVISAVPESQIIDFGINKGAMTIIDIEQAEKIYGLMDKKFEASGGSAANTLAGLSSLGGKGAFIGKVKNDSLGKIFCEDFNIAPKKNNVNPKAVIISGFNISPAMLGVLNLITDGP